MLEIKDDMFVSRLSHDNSVKIKGKMYNKKKYHTVGTVSKLNRKIAERGKIDTPKT